MTPLVRIAQVGTLLITWATKILGLAGGAEQLLLHADRPNSLALLVSGFMVAGAQGFEQLALRFLEKLLEAGRVEAPTDPKPQEEPGS